MGRFSSRPPAAPVAGARRRRLAGRLDRYRRRLAGLAASERRLLLKSWLVLAGIRLGLWILPYRRLVRGIERWQVRPAAPSHPVPALEQITWSVRAAARLVPRASCLTQALAGQCLLGRYGYAARLQIGASRGDDRAFEAHAWLEHEGRIVLGEVPDHGRFRPFRSGTGRGTGGRRDG